MQFNFPDKRILVAGDTRGIGHVVYAEFSARHSIPLCDAINRYA